MLLPVPSPEKGGGEAVSGGRQVKFRGGVYCAKLQMDFYYWEEVDFPICGLECKEVVRDYG